MLDSANFGPISLDDGREKEDLYLSFSPLWRNGRWSHTLIICRRKGEERIIAPQ